MKYHRLLLLSLPSLILGASWPAPLALSQTALDGFDPDVNGSVRALAVQTDGKIVIGGDFTSVKGVTRTNLARLNVDGSVDTSFAAAAQASVYALAVQPEGQIVVGGAFTALAGQAREFLGRLNADGTLDAAFDPAPDATVQALTVQPGGKIVVGGWFNILGGQPHSRLGRLNADGSLDSTFNPGPSFGVLSLTWQSDGKIVVGGYYGSLDGKSGLSLGRLNSDGSVDTNFMGGAVLEAEPGYTFVGSLAVQQDGKILVGGWFSKLANQSRGGFGRLNANGSLDTSFNAPGFGIVHSLALQSDGRILVGSVFSIINGLPPSGLHRLHPDGRVDTNFMATANNSVGSLAVQPDGKILVGGEFNMLNETNRNHLGRFYADGSLDMPLDPGATGEVLDGFRAVEALAVQPDGRLLLGGSFAALGSEPRNGIGRLKPDGNVDLSFNPDGHELVRALAVQDDGRMLVARWSSSQPQSAPYLSRLNSDGTQDTNFSTAPFATTNLNPSGLFGVALQPDGKILLAGDFTSIGPTARFFLARLNPNGSVDSTFNPGANKLARALAIQANGKILVGGDFTEIAGQPRVRLARLHADGGLDPTFNPDANSGVTCLSVQPDGKIIVGGGFTTLAGVSRTSIGRLNSNGTPDLSFDASASVPGGPVLPSIVTLGLQADGRILVGGYFTRLAGQPHNHLGRLNANGSLDAGFNADTDDWVLGSAIQPDGEIVVGGQFHTVAGQARLEIARITSSGPAWQSIQLEPNDSRVVWNRSGAGPEVYQVTFALSLDGANYTSLGNATRVPGGWLLTGLSSPAGRNFYIRARGRAFSGYGNASSGLIESVAQFYWLPPPYLSPLRVLGNGAFQFSFANTNATAFTVLATTNAAAPIADWQVLGTPTPGGGGSTYQFTDPDATNHSQRFYQLRGP